MKFWRLFCQDQDFFTPYHIISSCHIFVKTHSIPRPRLYFLSSRCLETKTLVLLNGCVCAHTYVHDVQDTAKFSVKFLHHPTLCRTVWIQWIFHRIPVLLIVFQFAAWPDPFLCNLSWFRQLDLDETQPVVFFGPVCVLFFLLKFGLLHISWSSVTILQSDHDSHIWPLWNKVLSSVLAMWRFEHWLNRALHEWLRLAWTVD